MDKKTIHQQLNTALETYVTDVRTELSARWNAWPLDLSKADEHAVIGGLLARIVTLATQLARNPQIWNAHIAPMILRGMIDTLINLAWIIEEPAVRSEEFIAYGLGQMKLEIEHLRAMEFSDEDHVLSDRKEWLHSQRLEEFTTVNVGSWSGLDTRKIADSLGYGDIYKLNYGPFSAAVHSHWHHVGKLNLESCRNPLHRFHKIPTDPDLDTDPEYMFIAADYVSEAFNRFDEKLGINVDIPSAFTNLETAFDYVIDAIDTQSIVTDFMSGNVPISELSTLLDKLGDPDLPNLGSGDGSRTHYLQCLLKAARCACLYIGLAAVVPPNPSDDRWRILLAGHMARLYKLYDTCLFLIVSRRQEMGAIQLASIFATIINLRALMNSSDLTKSEEHFVLQGLRSDKRLWNMIKANMHKPPLDIEQRMLNSIQRAFDRAGVSKAQVSSVPLNHETELKRSSKTADIVNLYEFGYLTAANAVYGTWHDIEFNHLTERDGECVPNLEYQYLQPQLVESASIACLSLTADYANLTLNEQGKPLVARIHYILDWFQNAIKCEERNSTSS